MRAGPFLAVSFLLFTACAHTVKERMGVLSGAKPADCPYEIDKLDLPDPALILPNEWTPGELREGACTRAVSRRSSWQLFRFLPKDTRADLEIRARILPGGIGFGGEHSMIVPEVLLLEGARRSSASVRPLLVRAEEDPATGTSLVFLFSLTGLTVDRQTGIFVTADLSQAGKRIENAVQSRLKGAASFRPPVLAGPFGPFELRLISP